MSIDKDFVQLLPSTEESAVESFVNTVVSDLPGKWTFKMRKLAGGDWVCSFTHLFSIGKEPIEYGSKPCKTIKDALSMAAASAIEGVSCKG